MLLETIKIHKGEISNPDLHNARMHHSRRELFGIDIWEDIASLPGIRNVPVSDQVIKARIIYAEKILHVEWGFYSRRMIKNLRIVEDNEIDYSHKYSDRSRLNGLFAQRKDSDDIIIVKKGMITDSSYCNLAFFDGRRWVTPSSPLLKGTKRQQLIGEGVLFEEELKVGDLKRFGKCSLINALNELGEMEVGIGEIVGA
jgi:4-amino-4-deoxychorismate lyase